MLSLLGTVIKAVRCARHFIWEMDVYPDVAISLGYFKAGGLLDRIVGTLADFSRSHADGILALGECMKQRLIARNIASERIFVAENWADSVAIQPVTRPGSKDKLVLLYSGNLGLAHDIDTIASAMLALRSSQQFSFIFTGGGSRRKELEAFCHRESIETAEFRPYVQRMNLGESLGAGDIGLVTQQDSCLGAVVPSKVYGLLAAGRPILFIGPEDATPARMIRRYACGWHIACGDAPALTKILLRLSLNPTEVFAAGQRARQVLLEHFDRPIGVARICDVVGARPLYPTAGKQKSALQNLEEIPVHQQIA
jgi:colanic acid biosynthesis glycosyl transferase WcaI